MCDHVDSSAATPHQASPLLLKESCCCCPTDQPQQQQQQQQHCYTPHPHTHMRPHDTLHSHPVILQWPHQQWPQPLLRWTVRSLGCWSTSGGGHHPLGRHYVTATLSRTQLTYTAHLATTRHAQPIILRHERHAQAAAAAMYFIFCCLQPIRHTHTPPRAVGQQMV
jgi:hypothetical protein